MHKKIHLFFVFIFSLSALFGQQKTVQNKDSYVISWKPVEKMAFGEGVTKEFLCFKGAVYSDNSSISHFFTLLNVIKSSVIPDVRLVDMVFESVPDADLEIIKNQGADIKDNIEITSKVSYQNKKPLMMLSFIPLRTNSSTGKIERLVSFKLDYSYNKSNVLPLKKKSYTYADHSVLKSGDWYRVDVFRSGIHKITYDDLVALGMDVSSIDPRNIRLYGNGGKMLPENNMVYRPDDLKENAIYIYGESDGVFNQGDYIIFYAQGPESWAFDAVNDSYKHQINKYNSSTAYFLSASLGPGRRIGNEPSSSLPVDYTVTTFDDHLFHEKDSLNLIKSGREFYGEVFDVNTSYSFSFNFPNIVPSTPVKLRTHLLARSILVSTSFKLYSNGSYITTLPLSPASSNYINPYATENESSLQFSSSGSISLRFDYNKSGNSSAIGWLDYVELNAERYLSFVSGQMPFRNHESVGKGITEFIVENSNNNVVVWDVTDYANVRKVDATHTDNNLSYRLNTDSLREFVAFDDNGFYSVSCTGKVQNQDLHGLGVYNMIIISYPDLIDQAERLADFHRNNDGLSVLVVTPQLIYNEFSSGNQDITALKDFVKMFYDRAGSDSTRQPGYLLLFGDASYDYQDRIVNNTNRIPTYQTVNSLDPSSSYLTDDYVGFLDDTDSGPYGNLLDIAVGRIPAQNIEEARAIVDKIINYKAKYDLNTGTPTCSSFSATISNLADWRNTICFVADDADTPGEGFLGQSEDIATFVDTTYNNFNIDKIYCDAYTQISTPGGQRYPEVNDAINKRVAKGALIINYIGHGGEVGWAHEAILGVSDINSWSNKNSLPFFVTATCEFSRFDDPARTSAGEYVILNPTGGGVSLFTTTRIAFSGSNAIIDLDFYKNVFKKTGGKYPFIGDVIRAAKNMMGCDNSISNFVLLGDPALKLVYPEHNIVTTKINNHPIASLPDTINALDKVTIQGYIADNSGNKLTSYQGTIMPTVYDKMMDILSNGNDGATPQSLTLQKNIIYKGKAHVINGDFSFTFVVPKDIAYNYGKGRISYYSQNGTTDAGGYYENFLIGGTNNNEITDKDGPDIKLYMNDNHFVSGGITDKNPVLMVYLSDSAGVNTIGSGIGHDISAVLDGNTDKTFILNDYYESDYDTYCSGLVRYPFSSLDVGEHKLTLKAWDVYNNSSENELDFVVAESADLALSHVLNYPNPFTTYTEFWFEHNQPCCGLDVQVQIFTITGKLIKTIQTRVETDGFRADPIPWDGKDDFGDNIGKGVYVYTLKVKSNSGQYSEKTEKLVILK